MSQAKLADAFAGGAKRGIASSMYIQDDTIYSYGSHFPIARRINSGEYLYNCLDYSHSTSKHKHVVLVALAGNTLWFAPYCDRHLISDWLCDEIEVLHSKILVARSRLTDYIHQLEHFHKSWEAAKRRFELQDNFLDHLVLFKGKDEVRSLVVAGKLATTW